MKPRNTLIMLSILTFFGCKTHTDLPTVTQLDIKKYSGLWYELARLPNSFEKGMDCTTATYTPKENGKIEVFNQGRKTDKNNELSNITGTAWVPDAAYPARLKVRFFWPFAGDYYIMYLDQDYQYALVGAPNRKYLWILARTKTLDDKTYYALIQKAKTLGFETDKILRVNQICE